MPKKINEQDPVEPIKIALVIGRDGEINQFVYGDSDKKRSTTIKYSRTEEGTYKRIKETNGVPDIDQKLAEGEKKEPNREGLFQIIEEKISNKKLEIISVIYPNERESFNFSIEEDDEYNLSKGIKLTKDIIKFLREHPKEKAPQDLQKKDSSIQQFKEIIDQQLNDEKAGSTVRAAVIGQLPKPVIDIAGTTGKSGFKKLAWEVK